MTATDPLEQESIVRNLEEAAAQYEEQGFAIIRDVLPADVVAEADIHVKWLMSKYPDLRPEHLRHPLIRHDAFWVRPAPTR